MTRDPLLWHPSKSLRAIFKDDLIRRLLPLTYRAIAARYRSGRTVVLGGSLGLAPRIANEKLGVPLATIHLQPIAIHSVVAPPKFPQASFPNWSPLWLRRAAYWYAERHVMDGYLAAPVNDFRREIGLPPVRRIWGRWRHSPQLILGLFPDWFASAPDWPPHMHTTGFVRYDGSEAQDLPPEIAKFLNDGAPPIVVSFGSAMRQGRPYFEAAVEACRRLKRRALILAKGGDQIPPTLPPGCAQFDYAPFSLIFPRAAAVIHHGGIGTTAQALAAGVPQCVMPLAFDQPDNADRLVRLGVAKALPAAKFTADRATRTLRELLDDANVNPVCQRVQVRITDPLPRICSLIEGLVQTV